VTDILEAYTDRPVPLSGPTPNLRGDKLTPENAIGLRTEGGELVYETAKGTVRIPLSRVPYRLEKAPEPAWTPKEPADEPNPDSAPKTARAADGPRGSAKGPRRGRAKG
jgi:hypothetical protein